VAARDPPKWYDEKADNPPWIKALAEQGRVLSRARPGDHRCHRPICRGRTRKPGVFPQYAVQHRRPKGFDSLIGIHRRKLLTIWRPAPNPPSSHPRATTFKASSATGISEITDNWTCRGHAKIDQNDPDPKLYLLETA
jgi:hypothetical protein